MIDPRIKKLEDQVSELMQRTANLPARWAKGGGGGGMPCKLVDLDGSLSAGSSATGSIYEWNGSAWTDTTENMTVRDFREAGDAIASGSRCVVTRMNGEWWVIATECPA